MGRMKHVHDQRTPIDALAGRLQCPASPAFFRFLMRRIRIQDVRLEGGELVYSSFLPVEQLFAETLAELNGQHARPTPCTVCAEVFDAEHDDGIFEQPARLEGFICRPCAEKISAWDYFQDRLRI